MPFTCGKNGSIWIYCKVDGHRRRFLFDTGSAWSFVNSRWIKQRCDGASAVIEASGGDGESYNYVKVNSLIIGGLKIKDALVLADKRPESSYGTIGMDLLKRFSVTVDFSTRKISFADSLQTTSTDESLMLPFILGLGIPSRGGHAKRQV